MALFGWEVWWFLISGNVSVSKSWEGWRFLDFDKGLKKFVCQFLDGRFGGFLILIRVLKNLMGTFWLGCLVSCRKHSYKDYSPCLCPGRLILM